MAKEIMGNKFLVLVFNTETRSPTITGTMNSNIQFVNVVYGPKLEFKDGDLAMPMAGKYHMLTQQVHAALKWAAEYRSIFNWDFVVKMEGDMLIDLDKLITLNIDDRTDAFASFNGGAPQENFWIAGPRVVQTYTQMALPTTYYNSKTWRRLERFVPNAEDRAAAIPEHEWFWCQTATTVPFARIGGINFVIGAPPPNIPALGSGVSAQLNAMRIFPNAIVIDEPSIEAVFAQMKRKMIAKQEGTIRIVTSAFGPGEVKYLKPMLESAKQFLLTNFNRHFVVYTDEVALATELLKGTTNLHIHKINHEDHILMEESRIVHSTAWETPAADWIVYARNRMVFIKPVGIEILPTQIEGGVSMTGIFDIDQKGNLVPKTMAQAGIAHGSSNPPAFLKYTNSMIDSSNGDKICVTPNLIVLDINGFVPNVPYLSEYVEQNKKDIKQHGNPVHFIMYPNWFAAKQEIFPKILNRYYAYPITTPNNDLGNVRVVLNMQAATIPRSEPVGKHIVKIGYGKQSIAEQIERYAWYKQLKARYPNSLIAAGDGFAWDAFPNDIYEEVARSNELKVAVRTDISPPNIDALMVDTMFGGNVSASFDANFIAPFICKHTGGILSLVLKFVRKEKCVALWNSIDMTKDYSKYSAVLLVGEGIEPPEFMPDNFIFIDMMNLDSATALDYIKCLVEVTQNDGDYGLTPTSRVVAQIADMLPSKKK